jgi:hypothetical protein
MRGFRGLRATGEVLNLWASALGIIAKSITFGAMRA